MTMMTETLHQLIDDMYDSLLLEYNPFLFFFLFYRVSHYVG